MGKVRSIEFKDYKSFSRFIVSARDRNVLVGPNNAGKSTALDAFRIAFDALRYAKRRKPFFKSQNEHGVCSTWSIPVSAIQTDLRSCVHNFGEGPAQVTIKLENTCSFVISIPSEGDLECFLIANSSAQKNTVFLGKKFPLNLVIVPTLSPLEQNEELVTKETVEKNRFSRLASRNFRNFWLDRSREDFDKFAELVEMGWPGIKISPPEIEQGGPKPIVRMYFRDGSNVREIQWAGFGFQVWMQTMMHLCFADSNSTLILDEPDIYLHPDLQHRLLRLIGDRVGQYFVATHSTEIINHVEPGDVLIVRPEARGAKRIQTESGYSDVYSAIGSSENAQFARLAKTKKVLYFEGKDAKLVSKISRRVFGEDFLSDGSVTLMKTDGFSNWTRVTTSSWVFENFFGFHIPVGAIFDRDFRCTDEIEEFLAKINDERTLCRVLPCKEIENFLLDQRAITKVIEKFSSTTLPSNYQARVEEIIDSAFQESKLKTLSARIGSRISYEVGRGARKDIATISADEEAVFTAGWNSYAFRQKVVPGKVVLAEIAGRLQSVFGVTVTPSRIVDELDVSQIDAQLSEILYDVRRHLGEP